MKLLSALAIASCSMVYASSPTEFSQQEQDAPPLSDIAANIVEQHAIEEQHISDMPEYTDLRYNFNETYLEGASRATNNDVCSISSLNGLL